MGKAPALRSDGTFTRDYLYVEDVVAAYLTLAEQVDRDGVRGEAFNFSPERQLSVLELVQQLLTALGRPDLQPVILDTARAEIRDQYLDAGKARRVLGWQAGVSLQEGLTRTVAWYRTFLAAHR